VLVVASLVALFPVYVMVTAAFKTQGGFLNDPFAPLTHPTLNGFRTALNDQFPRWLLNSAMVTVAAVAATLLLAALAACQETTLRMVAANMGIGLNSVRVEVDADWDARGTLAMGAPVGITAIRCRTAVVVDSDQRGERAERLLRSAEKYCVILDTLRSGVPVESTFTLSSTAPESAPTSETS